MNQMKKCASWLLILLLLSGCGVLESDDAANGRSNDGTSSNTETDSTEAEPAEDELKYEGDPPEGGKGNVFGKFAGTAPARQIWKCCSVPISPHSAAAAAKNSLRQPTPMANICSRMWTLACMHFPFVYSTAMTGCTFLAASSARPSSRLKQAKRSPSGGKISLN